MQNKHVQYTHNLSPLNEMHIQQRNHWNDMLSIGTNRTIGTNGPSESLCMQQNHMENNLSPRNEMHINQ